MFVDNYKKLHVTAKELFNSSDWYEFIENRLKIDSLNELSRTFRLDFDNGYSIRLVLSETCSLSLIRGCVSRSFATVFCYVEQNHIKRWMCLDIGNFSCRQRVFESLYKKLNLSYPL